MLQESCRSESRSKPGMETSCCMALQRKNGHIFAMRVAPLSYMTHYAAHPDLLACILFVGGCLPTLDPSEATGGREWPRPKFEPHLSKQRDILPAFSGLARAGDKWESSTGLQTIQTILVSDYLLQLRCWGNTHRERDKERETEENHFEIL